MDNAKLIDIVRNPLAIDYNCHPDDFLKMILFSLKQKNFPAEEPCLLFIPDAKL